MDVHDFTVTAADGSPVALSTYAGSVLLIVNTASKCGLTPQYEGLQALQDAFGGDRFTVLGFPCNQFAGQEPGTDAEIQQFCSMTYNVTFPVMAKIEVNGANADPLYAYLTEERPGIPGGEIAWNFTKFLVDADGTVVQRYAPQETPDSIAPDIRAAIGTEG